MRVDRCLSMNGLEPRLPFLDIDFIEYIRGLNASIKVPTKNNMEKWFIR